MLEGRPHGLSLRLAEPGRKHSLSQAACHTPCCTGTRVDEVPLDVFTLVAHKIVNEGLWRRALDVRLGKGCPCHPHSVPCKETGVAQAVDLFREVKTESQDVGSLLLVAPTSSEPRGMELRTEAVG